MAKKIEFCIGNINENYDFKNTNIMPPLAGKELANEIRKHITASENIRNHHIEAHNVTSILILKVKNTEYCHYGLVLK